MYIQLVNLIGVVSQNDQNLIKAQSVHKPKAFTMPKHSVKLNLPSTEIGSSDVIIDVTQDGGKLGTLKISKGGLDWTPRYAKIISLNWTQFDKLLQDNTKK